MSAVLIPKLTIVGVGSIGGSLAKALKQAGAVGEVVGYSRSKEHLQKALELGVIDCLETDIQVATNNADMLVLAVPVGSISEVLHSIQPHLDSKTIITDVGSTKGSVVEAVQQVFSDGGANFVPGHPIAGTEKSGVTAAITGLFNDRIVILTPQPNTSQKAIELVQEMWQTVGAKVEILEVEHHDEVLAATSHLPHMLAFTLVDTLSQMEDKREIFKFAAGGFRDFTRIASSDPLMWRDICVHNSSALIGAIHSFQAELGLLAKAIETKDADKIQQIFERAKQARDQFQTSGIT